MDLGVVREFPHRLFIVTTLLPADPEDLQQSPVFKQWVAFINRKYFVHNAFRIGARGYFFYLLFQCFIHRALWTTMNLSYADLISLADLDGLNDRNHMFKSLILGGQGPYIGLPSHSFLSYMGPQVRILMLDCR